MEDIKEGIVLKFALDGRPFGFISWEDQTIFFHLEAGRIPMLIGEEIRWNHGNLRWPTEGDRVSFILDTNDSRGSRVFSWIYSDQPPVPFELSDVSTLKGTIVRYFPDSDFAFANVAGQGDFYLRKSRLRVPVCRDKSIVWASEGRHELWYTLKEGDEILLNPEPVRKLCAREWVLAVDLLACEKNLKEK